MNQTLIESFFEDHHAQFSTETVRSYKMALNQFFCFCELDFDKVTKDNVRDWLVSMMERNLKPLTIRLKLSALKSFYKYCMEENHLKKNPTIKVKSPKKEDSLPYYLSKRKLALLQELTIHDIRDRAIVDTLYTTGVRVSELLQIRIEDVKWDTRQIWIRKGKGNRERFVLFTHACAERLKMYIQQQEKNSVYLFPNNRGGHLSRVFVEKRFQKFSDILGFKVVPHTMRHTFAAHLAEKGMDFSYIQDLLGHANINSTRIYTRLMNHARKQKYDQLQK